MRLRQFFSLQLLLLLLAIRQTYQNGSVPSPLHRPSPSTSRNRDVFKVNQEEEVAIPFVGSESVPSVASIFAPSSPAVTNALCRNHTLLYLKALKNATLWATQMYESSAKLPTGFFFGSTHQLGNFDECLSIRSIVEDEFSEKKVSFSGRYCLATLNILPADLPKPHGSGTSGDIWAKVKRSIDFTSENPLNIIHWAVCMPSTCSHNDLQSHLNYIIPQFNSLKALNIPINAVKVEIKKSACTSEEDDDSLTTGQTVMLCFIALLILLAISGSIFDYHLRKTCTKCKGNFQKILKCFSVITNVEKLSKDYKSDTPLNCLSGMKTMSMFLIIFGHRLLFTLGGALNNSEYIEKRYKRIETALLLGGLTVVDTFYLISGFLLCYCMLMESHKLKNASVMFYLFIRRYIRLTPVYMFVVAFYGTLYIKLGYGPLWNAKIGVERDRCVNNWWTNLLYINTIVNSDAMCVIQSWYVASDMHLFIISIPIVYMIAKRPNIGKILLSLLFIVSVAVPFAVTYYQQLEPLVLSYMENLIDLLKYDTFRFSYIQTYMRGTPYFIGIALGYVLYSMKMNDIKIPQIWIHVIITSTFIMGFAPILIATIFYQPEYEYTPFAAAIYASLHRVSWGLSMSGCILACVIEKEWFLMRCLSWSMFKPLSKLTYTAYLLHAAIQIYGVASLQNPQHMSIFTMLHETFGDVFVTIFLAFIVSMLVEAPLLGIEKFMFSEGKKSHANVPSKPRSIKKSDDLC